MEYAFLKHFISQAVLETVARVGRVKLKKSETNEEKYAMLSYDSLSTSLKVSLLLQNERLKCYCYFFCVFLLGHSSCTVFSTWIMTMEQKIHLL